MLQQSPVDQFYILEGLNFENSTQKNRLFRNSKPEYLLNCYNAFVTVTFQVYRSN